ncbi:MAG: DUF1508 domain-containing protein [Litorimonas sp.]
MADRKTDDYKAVKFYADNTKAKKAGFSKFEKDNEFFFCRYIDGDIAMLSQAYTSAAGRDNGIESVKKNEKLVKRYVFGARGSKKHGFALKAGNGQEIAISPNYASLTDAEHVSGRLTGKAKAKKVTPKKVAPKKVAPKPKAKKTVKATAAATAFTASDSRIENYKPLAFYKKHGGKADGFNSFEEDGASYFHFNADGEIVLISESYTSKRGRDNGIASVKKNMNLETAYQYHQHKNGKHYFDINAANKQEIATSRWYDSKKLALAGAASLRGETKKPSAGNNEQNYMPLAFYKKATEGKEKGFESFKGEDGEYYFVYFENNKIALISEGYPTAAVRDKGLASVEKNMNLEDRYVFGTNADGKEGFVLRAGNHKEIARSVGYGSAAAALAGADYLLGTRRRVSREAPKTVAAPVVAGAAAAGIAAKANASKSGAEEAVPAAAPIVAAVGTAAVAGVAATAAAPKAEPAAHMTSAAGGGSWGWLKWLLLGLIGLLAAMFLFKTCAGGPKDVKTPAVATTTETAAPTDMVTCWNGSKAKSDQSCPVKITCWDDSFAEDLSACPVQPAAKDFDCWDGSKAVNQSECPVQTVTENTYTAVSNGSSAEAENTSRKTAAGTTIRSASPTTIVANATSAQANSKMSRPSVFDRICAPSSNPLFNVVGSTPINVGRLGTNPQFGNSLSLTPDGFYQKLKTAYQTNTNDRAFLDLLARSLGHGSFNNMDASMFSHDTLPFGSSGLLGFGSEHVIQFSTLNTSDTTHLEAFKIQSVNGTDVHFMKRCGNYMYVCQP